MISALYGRVLIIPVSAVPAQATAVGLGPPHEPFTPVPVEVPGPVGLEVTKIEVLPVAAGMEVTLSVETVGGRMLVDGVTVEHAATPQGPWSAVGAISGDGMSYTGTVTAPAGGTGFITVRVP